MNFHVALKSTQAVYLQLCGTISQTPAELRNVSYESNSESANEVGTVSIKSFCYQFLFSDAFFLDMQSDDMSINALAMGGTSVAGFNSSEW